MNPLNSTQYYEIKVLHSEIGIYREDIAGANYVNSSRSIGYPPYILHGWMQLMAVKTQYTKFIPLSLIYVVSIQYEP